MAKKRAKQGVRTFPGLDRRAFQHPADREAMRKLDRLPGLQKLLTKVSSDFVEKTFRMLNTAERVRVTTKQCPRIYELVREACEVLDVPA